MGPFSRREFLHRSALLAAAAGLGSRRAAAEESPVVAKGSAADRVRVAVVGVRSRGLDHVKGYLGNKDSEIVAICDCDEAVIGRAMGMIADARGAAPRFEKDFRRLLDDKGIDAISIATPNHWHVLMAVWAMRAGKDVYCEKPVSHNVREGRLLADAVAKYGRLCQVGTQSRSNPGMKDAIGYIHAGKIGDVKLAYGTCYKRRISIGKVDAPTEPPPSMDYDLWCGPARVLPVQRKSVHYDWHWVWEYGNGDFGNQGVHEVDKARWGLNKAGMPNSVVAVGGRFGYVDDGETPNTQLALFDYGDRHLIFEVRGLASTNPFPGGVEKNRKPGDNFVGNIWYGTEGVVVCPSYQSGIALDKDGNKVADFKGGRDQFHFDNFLAAVKSRNPAELNCPAEEGHQSAALCHLANISYRLGAEATLATADAAFRDDPDAAEALIRMKEHLKANDVDPAQAVGRVGPRLTIDPTSEKITSAGPAELSAANALLFREYRQGFDLTESV